jgi:delta 1-pyrroline-5-carboxylate dehydrogenase
MDLFRVATEDSADGAPAWQELPSEARSMLTSLIAQLILDHAGKTLAAPAREAGHDL